MKPWIIAFCICIFYFMLPLQLFIIGNDMGIGIQGAVYRYQISPQGISLIPLTSEVFYVTSGLYQGRTAMSVTFWVLGTAIFTVLTIASLVYWNQLSLRQIRIIMPGLAGAGFCYLVSCGFQYGVLLSGSAGKSLPIGIIFLIIFSIFVYYYQYLFQAPVDNSMQNNNFEQ